jgi:hypothetical protein
MEGEGGGGMSIKYFFLQNWTSSAKCKKKKKGRFVVYGLAQQRNVNMNMNVNIVCISNRPFQTQQYTFGFHKEVKFLVIINIKS